MKASITLEELKALFFFPIIHRALEPQALIAELRRTVPVATSRYCVTNCVTPGGKKLSKLIADASEAQEQDQRWTELTCEGYKMHVELSGELGQKTTYRIVFRKDRGLWHGVFDLNSSLVGKLVGVCQYWITDLQFWREKNYDRHGPVVRYWGHTTKNSPTSEIRQFSPLQIVASANESQCIVSVVFHASTWRSTGGDIRKVRDELGQPKQPWYQF